MQQLREELKDIDRRFATLSLKLYFVADSDEEVFVPLSQSISYC